MLEKEEIIFLVLEDLKNYYCSIIILLGEDVEWEGLLKIFECVVKVMLILIKGYYMDLYEVFCFVKFQEEYSQMVIVKDIDFFLFCEYYMLFFYGKVYVVYIFNGYIIGLSKIVCVVDIFFYWL